MSGFLYVRFYSGDWRNDTISLTHEQKGLLIDLCAFRWDVGRPIPSDRTEASRILRINRNKYDRILDALIAQGLVDETDDGLIVDQAEREYEAACNAAKKNVVHEPARKPAERTIAARHERKASTDTLTHTPPHTPTHAGGVTPKVDVEKSEQNQWAFIEKDKDKEKERKKEQTDRPVVSAAREDVRPTDVDACKTAFNGSTDAMLSTVMTAMGAVANRNEAASWLASLCRINGQEAVSQSFQMLQTAKIEGRPIAKVLPWWSKTASTLKGKMPAASASAAKRVDPPGTVYVTDEAAREYTRSLIRESQKRIRARQQELDIAEGRVVCADQQPTSRTITASTPSQTEWAASTRPARNVPQTDPVPDSENLVCPF